ncbi:hypothetical protein Tco_0424834 [Tanacetum coccineum]
MEDTFHMACNFDVESYSKLRESHENSNSYLRDILGDILGKDMHYPFTQEDFSQHLSDDEESNHEDASDTGAAPKQQQVIPQSTAISNIKLPILKKEEYDTSAIEMEHYLEYIDNDVWKVIQNGNSKKRISTGKGWYCFRILSPVTAAKIQAVEKERKAKNILLMAIPKEHMRRFHGMDDAKEIWEAIRTRFGGNANSKKMQKAIFKQQFDSITISQYQNCDANHKILKIFGSQHGSNRAMTMRTKPEVDTLSIDDLYNNLRVFEQEIQVLGLLLLLQANIPKKEVLAGFADGRLSIPLCQTSEDRDLLHEESGSNLMI